MILDVLRTSLQARTIIVVSASITGCAALLDLPISESPRDPAADASVDQGAYAPLDASMSFDPIDADVPADDGGQGDGGRCWVTETFVPPEVSDGTVCNPNNVLKYVVGPAGLDRKVDGVIGTLGGVSVAACLGARFERALSQLHVRAWSVPRACDVGCASPCATSGGALLFVGAKTGVYTFVGTISISSTPSEFDIPLPAGASEVVICRGATSWDRDDVNVSSIVGECPS